MNEDGTETERKGDEAWFDPGFLDRLRALFLRLKKRKRRRKQLQQVPATAYTREFKDYRAYTTSDDFRSVDWRVYARLGRLFVRMYEEVQEYQVHILIDTSASMAEPYPEKRHNVLRLAVALSYLGLMGQHRVSVYTMKDRVTRLFPSVKGQGSIQRIVEGLRTVRFGGVTHLRTCFEEFRPSRQRYGVIFVLSDLFGQHAGSAEEAMRRVAGWPGETHVIQILHPEEREPGWEGEVRLTDAETGEERKMWLTKRELARYREEFDRFLDGVEKACLRRQVDHQVWMTDREFDEFFLGLMDRGSILGGKS